MVNPCSFLYRIQLFSGTFSAVRYTMSRAVMPYRNIRSSAPMPSPMKFPMALPRTPMSTPIPA